MKPEDSLIATRARRANAGSRLKHLLELEEINNELTFQLHNDDDDNVNLLFQEDEDDGEFMDESEAGEVSDEDEDNDDKDNGDQNDNYYAEKSDVDGKSDGEKSDIDEKPEGDELKSDSDSEGGLLKRRRDDEMLTDSDLSSSESDESEGEKELQAREKSRKRQEQKKVRAVVAPKITQRPKPAAPKPKRQAVEAVSLLSDSRRSSTRRAAVENKLAVVKKLQETEERRIKYFLSHTQATKETEPELTQEERLLQAVETEKLNILSLNRLHEQEEIRQERQRMLHAAKKMVLGDVCNFTSRLEYVTPLAEIQELQRLEELRLYQLRNKSRRGRKKKSVIEAERLEAERLEAERLEVERLETERKEAGLNEVEPTEVKNEVTGDQPNNGDQVNDEEQVDDEDLVKDGEIDEVGEIDKVGEVDEVGKVDVAGKVEASQFEITSTKPKIVNEATTTLMNNIAESPNNDLTNSGETKATDVDVEMVDAEEKPNQEDVKSETIIKSEPTDGIKTKSVTFAIPDTELQAEETFPVSESPLPELEGSEPADTYEGPSLKVACNYVSFRDLSREGTLYKPENTKEMLFGEQSLLTAHRRSSKVETIIRITSSLSNVNLSTNIDNLFKPYEQIYLREFDHLAELPRFGEFDKQVREIVKIEDEEEFKVEILTEAPSGILYPNGSKKRCFITGTSAIYFDPKSGIPYSSVDAYKVIQRIQDGLVPWCDFSCADKEDDESEPGAVEFGKYGAYIGLAGEQQHAKGVPEGFDG
ncbi:hypothetical protein BABINDRAFT_160124 [Babjeviella inositovora NRRL Y-12698]|uniref:Vps72/YL1 C-terminal domain-containing protein n=1 Tax=Babjeviella inositovora NRRL Y-12698 TaxID=984486 RepID=A0A1E3QW90_9ASCO|nr:uncharacterized protein BABINDRAFT_160124 [Babjeviella inositovora NRRL Y-12698]ODQ81891.1 hypothetical protein BABINDRAFT_160124 [Babjeviella inositovora NRRL Y-12698]